MNKIYLALPACALFSSCAISLNMPTVRFDVPEAQGQLGKGDVGVGAQVNNKLTIIQDTTANPIDDTRTFDSAAQIPIRVDVGLWDRLDVEGLSGPGTAGTSISSLRLKYQLVGEPRSSAAPGNFSVAMTFGGGAATRSQTDDDSIINPGTTARTEAHFWNLDGALILGYRINEDSLIYGGPFYTHYGFSGTINQSGSVTNQFGYSGNANQEGVNLGFSFGSHTISGRPEVALVTASSGAAHTTGVYAGGLFVIQW